MKIWEQMTPAERAPLIAENAERSRRRIEKSGRTHPARGDVVQTVSTYEQDRATLERLRADLEAKYPEDRTNATVRTTEIGPQTRAMMGLAAAVQQQRRGDVDQTSAGRDSHKLPPCVTYG